MRSGLGLASGPRVVHPCQQALTSLSQCSGFLSYFCITRDDTKIPHYPFARSHLGRSFTLFEGSGGGEVGAIGELFF